MSSNGLHKNEPRPRLCHLRRWPDFVGYGFNLHCEKSKPGQYIGKVDPDSPAESAGLRENDRIIEVNSVPIGNENHKQVVARIKEGVLRNGTKYPEEVVLLVVDHDTDEYYKSKSYIVRSNDANVEKLEAEIRDGSAKRNHSPHLSNRNNDENNSQYHDETPPQRKSNESTRDYRHVTDFTGPTVTHNKNTNSPTISKTSDHNSEPPEEYDNKYRSSPPISDKNKRKEYPSTNTYTNVNPSTKSLVQDFHTKPIGTNSSQTLSSANGTGALDLQMSAAEYREKLKAQNARKRDPRQNQQMSMKEKHDVIDRL